MRNELTCSSSGLSDAKAVDDVIEAALEELKKDFTRNALSALSLLEKVAELTLEYAIGVLSLLLSLSWIPYSLVLRRRLFPCCPGG